MWWWWTWPPPGPPCNCWPSPKWLNWYMTKLFPVQRTALKIARPIMRTVTDMPAPAEETLDAIEGLVKDLQRLEKLVTNPSISSVRLVLNPEKMVVKEAQRAFTYLNLYDLTTDAIISNRHIPDQVTDPYFAAWKESQARYSELVEQSFSPLPIFQAPLFDSEVVGVEALRRVAAAVYGEHDPTTIFYHEKPQQVIRDGEDYLLLLPLPLLDKRDVTLHRGIHDELAVRIGNWKRIISLPQTLIGRQVAGARYRENQLEIRFKPGNNGSRR